MDVQPGRYRHFKGKYYDVIGCARHSETEEEMVVYRDDARRLWVRPLTMFLERVAVGGEMIPRFAHDGPTETESTGRERS